MRFAVINAKQAETWVPRNASDRFIHISIHGWDQRRAKLVNNPNRMGTLFIQFDDIEREDPHFVSYTLFDEVQAKEILDFVNHWVNKDPSLDLIVVNCHAGVSRSAGVAAALAMIFNGDDSIIFGDPSFCPNNWVRSTILKVHFGEGSAFGEIEVEVNPNFHRGGFFLFDLGIRGCWPSALGRGVWVIDFSDEFGRLHRWDPITSEITMVN